MPKTFFVVRTVRHPDDLRQQLGEWLHHINKVRKSQATGEIPCDLFEQEKKWLAERPVTSSAEAYPLKESVVVLPTATFSYNGTLYSAPPSRIGAPGTLFVRAKTLELVVNGERAIHERADHVKTVQRLPQHRRAMLTVIHGERKMNYYRRQCLLELGEPAQLFLEQLVHRHPGGSWTKEVNQLFDLLGHYSDDDIRWALSECTAHERFDAASVRRQLRGAA